MTRKNIYFGTNLKMYKGNSEVVEYLSELSNLSSYINSEFDIKLFVIPSYTSLKDAVELIKSKQSKINIAIGAQNMNSNNSGQFTGEISPLMLEELGISLVMIGHSERRHVMKETDQEENEKVLSSLKHNFTTLLCIGETLEQKNYNISDEVLRTQLKIGLHGVSKEQLSHLWIAYEPVWAIGTNGTPATAEYADNKHSIIKQCLMELFGKESQKIPVLYGGSVNLQNANSLIIKPNIDGLFVGRSAWNAMDFYTLINNTLKAFSYNNIENTSNDRFTEIAYQLIQKLGGKDNIGALTHCATRIRVVLKNKDKMDKYSIEKIDEVKGIFSIADQYQIILGSKIVTQVHDSMLELKG